jgi:hypothetical protein
MLAGVGRPLRLMIYDATCTRDLPWPRPSREGLLRKVHDRLEVVPLPGLSHFWAGGGLLYAGLRRIDRFAGFTDWETALRWLAEIEPSRTIGEIQFWGHGKWGAAKIDREPLDIETLALDHRLRRPLEAIRERLDHDGALWWFRTCETFGAEPGHAFAQAWTEFFGCRAAGHTYVIGPWQSGLHSLEPGETPRWSVAEGLTAGTPDDPRAARWSRLGEPNTISCLHGRIPAGY